MLLLNPTLVSVLSLLSEVRTSSWGEGATHKLKPRPYPILYSVTFHHFPSFHHFLSLHYFPLLPLPSFSATSAHIVPSSFRSTKHTLTVLQTLHSSQDIFRPHPAICHLEEIPWFRRFRKPLHIASLYKSHKQSTTRKT